MWVHMPRMAVFGKSPHCATHELSRRASDSMGCSIHHEALITECEN